jgi:hypothetical protein
MKNQIIKINLRKNMKTKNIIPTPIQSEICEIPSSIKLTREYGEFIKFCATPRILRKIKTQREFAKKFGVSEDTLTDWKKTPGFLAVVRQIILEREQERLSDVIEGLYREARKGNPSAVRLWLQYVGEMELKKLKKKD